MLPAQVLELIIKLAADPREVEFSVEVGHANFVVNGKPMARRAGNNEPLRIEFRRLKGRRKPLRTGHQRHIELAMQEIRYFLAMSRALNFTKAAKGCHVSQPALTRAIRKMEDELGGLLFSREPNNTHMTALGRLIEPHLTEIVAHAGEAKRSATRFLKLEGASLALGIMCTVAPVPSRLPFFWPLPRSNRGS